MGARAPVVDVEAAELVLVPSDRRVWYRAIRLVELTQWDPRDLRPMSLRRVQVEPLMEVHARTETSLVDLEEVPEPRTEEPDHRRITVREAHTALGLRAFA